MNLLQKLFRKAPVATGPKINFMLLEGSVVLNYDGKTISIAKSDARYVGVDKALREKRFDLIPQLAEPERQFEGSGLELKGETLYELNGEALPQELYNRIFALKKEGHSIEPLLKFWDNLKQNPSFNSRQMLFKFLAHNGHPLTEDGCFIAYRGVREDFKDKHTGTIDNSVGAKPSMDRSLVDDNPNNTCSSGYHVACFDYAKGFGEQLVEVKVNPIDVVCVPIDYDGTKMRVCAYEVVALCKEILSEPLYEPGKAAKVCPVCSTEAGELANFCTGCGSELDESEEESEEEESEEEDY